MRELIVTDRIDSYGDNILSNEFIYYKDDKTVSFNTDKVDGVFRLYTIKDGEGTIIVPYNFEEGNNNYNNF